MNRSMKIFTATAVTASAIMPVAVSADSTTFFDVETTNSHFDAITSLVERGIIKGYEDGTYRPNVSLTRGQAAKILVNTLKLDTSSKEQIFTDVPATLEYVGAINALAKAGIINGYEDGTFKPNAPLTRGQMAKIIVKAYKLKEATELSYSFTDISNNNGFNYYIQTLLNYGITQGTTATTFAPTEAVKRGQMASFVVRAENELAAKTPEKELETENNPVEKPAIDDNSDSLGSSGNIDSGSTDSGNISSGNTGSGNISSKTITGDVVATDDTVTINGKKVAVPNNLQSFFSTNEEALKEAQMTVVVKNNTITQITSLTLNASDTPDSLITFNGAGATIDGNVKINTAKINIANLSVTGNISIAHTVEEINFNAVDVKGSVITEEVPATARFQRVASLAMFAATENPVTKLKITFANSTVAYMEIKKKDVELGLAGITTVTTVALLADHFTLLKSDVILPNLTISKGVTQIQLNSSIASVEVDSNDDIAISGSGNFASVVVKTDKTVSLNTTGTIAQLASDNKNVTLGTSVTVGATTSIKGEDKTAKDMISNYEEVKDSVNVDIKQEEFIKYIAAKIVPIKDKYGYATLSIINAENATIKYRPVSNFDGSIKLAKVGDQAPADAIIYNTGDQFIDWDNTKVEVYKVDKNNKVLDVFVAEESWDNAHPTFDLKYENNRFTLTTTFNADVYEKLWNDAFLLKGVILVDGVNTYEFEGFKELTWSKNANGLPTVSFDAPANFVYNAENYTNLYIMTSHYATWVSLNDGSYTKENEDQANIALIKSFLEKTTPSSTHTYAYESALRSLAYEIIDEYDEEGRIIGREYIHYFKELPFVKKEYLKALVAQNIETAEQVLTIIKDVNEQLKEKINVFETVYKDITSLLVENYHEYPIEEQLAADVTLEKIKAAKEKLAFLGDDIEENYYGLQHKLNVAEKLYNRFVLKLYDFEALKQALIRAEAITEDGYSKADWERFINAINTGHTVMNRVDITQREIDDTVKYIENTISSLLPMSKSVEIVDFTAELVNETGSINIHNLYYNEDKDLFQQGTTVTIDGQSAQFHDGNKVMDELSRQGYYVRTQRNENNEFTGVAYISKNGKDVTVENITSDTAGVFTETVVEGQKQVIFDSSKFVKHIAAAELSIKGEKPQTFDNADELIKKLKEVYPNATISHYNSYMEVKSDLIEEGDIAFVNVIGNLYTQSKMTKTVFILTFNENIDFNGQLMMEFTMDGTPVEYERGVISLSGPKEIQLEIKPTTNLLDTDSTVTVSLSGVKTEDGLAVPINDVVYVKEK